MRERRRYKFRTWSARIYGTYEGPWDLRITPYIRHQSGHPFGRTFVARLNYGNVRILAEPMDTRRMDDITLADVRVEKGFRLAGGGRVAAFVDAFNLLNANPEETAIWTSGSSFLTAQHRGTAHRANRYEAGLVRPACAHFGAADIYRR